MRIPAIGRRAVIWLGLLLGTQAASASNVTLRFSGDQFFTGEPWSAVVSFDAAGEDPLPDDPTLGFRDLLLLELTLREAPVEVDKAGFSIS